jgi:hypothetical protein
VERVHRGVALLLESAARFSGVGSGAAGGRGGAGGAATTDDADASARSAAIDATRSGARIAHNRIGFDAAAGGCEGGVVGLPAVVVVAGVAGVVRVVGVVGAVGAVGAVAAEWPPGRWMAASGTADGAADAAADALANAGAVVEAGDEVALTASTGTALDPGAAALTGSDAETEADVAAPTPLVAPWKEYPTTATMIAPAAAIPASNAVRARRPRVALDSVQFPSVTGAGVAPGAARVSARGETSGRAASDVGAT